MDLDFSKRSPPPARPEQMSLRHGTVFTMAVASHKDKKYVYHLTALDNLASVIEHGLLSRNELARRGLRQYDVADQEILDGRGDLADFVPFHFMTRNPFDYAVVRQHPTRRFVYVAMHRDYARSNNWRVIPRHPLSSGEEIQLLAWDAGIQAVQWDLLDKRGRYDSDHELKQACMAEALSPETVPTAAFGAIFFMQADEAKVRALAQHAGCYLNPNDRMFPGAQ